ncbi:nitrogen regulation protein NR(I) [Sphingomonas xinjiangensis]|uniref:DNA-binding transcriptional regulator NtrC n=1 Tax=Sphingomonas xinjiangensis TaxID=643568 RepID=A0A840YAA1_9SPHN|nr:nitrogen regulation protein NR(I) [Sphingomonas xinjiangensis]MBB5709225.1 two-component system nitrogen regulation response regulator GlnG [Sphingomonas xinjiangensis]
MATILVVDDDAAIRTVVAAALKREGHRVVLAQNIAELRRNLNAETPDVLITDVVLPDGNGLEEVTSVLGRHPDLPVIIFSAQNTLATAVRATEVGAFDYLPKPFDLDVLSQAVCGALSRRQGGADELIANEDGAGALIGRSPPMQDVYRVIARVVSNDLTVLITGESGTGKELVAKAIHDLGARRRAPFIALNMAAIPRELIEAELFGHERGAFTGAQARVAGKFEQASGGTLFLDEIGDMPMDAQTRLLRVLQSGEFTTVGGNRTIRVDVRIVAATNKELPQLVQTGQFREDLFYRLNVVPIALPALRDRRGDIPLLAHHFLDRAVKDGLPRKRLEQDALSALQAHHWPGNVRELENMMRRLSALTRDERIDGQAVKDVLGSGRLYAPAGTATLEAAVKAWLAEVAIDAPQAMNDGTLYDRLIEEVERPLIEVMLIRHGGNQLRAARAIGINRNTLRKRLDSLNIPSRDQSAPPTSD